MPLNNKLSVTNKEEKKNTKNSCPLASEILQFIVVFSGPCLHFSYTFLLINLIFSCIENVVPSVVCFECLAPLKLNENNEIECIFGVFFCYCLFSCIIWFVSFAICNIHCVQLFHFRFTQDFCLFIRCLNIQTFFLCACSVIAKLDCVCV